MNLLSLLSKRTRKRQEHLFMKIFSIFKRNKKNNALIAKERLQIIVSHRHSPKDQDLIQTLQTELLHVLQKYIRIDPEHLQVQLGKKGNHSTLELNVTLSD